MRKLRLRFPRICAAGLVLIAGAVAGCGPDTAPPNKGSGGSGGMTGAAGGGAAGNSVGGSGGAPGAGGSSGSGGSGGSGGMNVEPTGGSGGAGGMPAMGAFPVIVTTAFPNQGWFADPTLSAQFKPGSTIIKQSDAIAGPCAMRDPAAKGKCLKIVYTPPAGVTLAPMGFVGVFFLTSLMKDHPETAPPSKIGDANWGAEPGAQIPAGGARISFLGAADTDGQMVVFKAGTDRDLFTIPEMPVTLGTTWKSYSLPLPSSGYGANVVGGFAWVLLDESKPATFYLDNIVWE